MGIALGLTGIALTGIASRLAAVETDGAETELSLVHKHQLDIRMQSLREIRQALAKPLPPPEPLARITSHAAHRVGKTVAAAIKASRPNYSKSMAEARNVLGKIEPATPDPHQLNAYAEIDRHDVR